ncbi:MAG: hypothetical protein ACI4UO_05410, partial [Paludibacteraceae bacterium]
MKEHRELRVINCVVGNCVVGTPLRFVWGTLCLELRCASCKELRVGNSAALRVGDFVFGTAC